MTLNASIDRRFVVCGARTGEVNRVRECTYTAGGKGLNVSRALALSGVDGLAGGLVGGYSGNFIEAELDKAGIAHDFYRVSEESRSCINIWDEATKQQTEYLEPGFMIDSRSMEGFLQKFRVQIQKADVLTISGSVPKGVGDDIYKRMVSTARDYGKSVILDSSGPLLEAALPARPTLIKPNIDEIRLLTGKACERLEEILTAAEELQGRGIQYVVISLGGQGALMVCDTGCYQAVIPQINTVNTVGCGDAMVAGLAMGVEKGLSPEELLLTASGIAAAAAMSKGTGYYKREDQKRLYNQINIKKI